jgi:DNA-binding beta-propeller fold protein YncE
MPLAITINDIDASSDNIYVFGSLTASGSYSTGGDTLDFTTVASQVAASQTPVQVWIGGTTGDSYSWIMGSELNNQKVKINTTSNTELSSGAYPSRITGDANVQFEAVFNKLI